MYAIIQNRISIIGWWRKMNKEKFKKNLKDFEYDISKEDVGIPGNVHFFYGTGIERMQ